jgi:hypothetical protein
MYKITVQHSSGKAITYANCISSREEAEYAASEAFIEFGHKPSIYIEQDMELEYGDNIQES